MNAQGQDKNAQVKNNQFVAECKVAVAENGNEIVGYFHAVIPLDIVS